MTELSLDEIRHIQLHILRECKRVCELLELRWFLSHGTLWGAVRNGGYLPGDDDIDIQMFREEYVQLCASFNSHCASHFKLLDEDNTEAWYYGFAKIVFTPSKLSEPGVPEIPELGIYIDIFPTDKLPETPLRRKWMIYQIMRLHKKRYRMLTRNKSTAPLEGSQAEWMKKLLEKNRSINTACNHSDSTLLCCGLYCVVPASVFEGTKHIDFEGISCPVPSDSIRWLYLMYGKDLAYDFKTPSKGHQFTAILREGYDKAALKISGSSE